MSRDLQFQRSLDAGNEENVQREALAVLLFEISQQSRTVLVLEPSPTSTRTLARFYSVTKIE